MRAIGIVRRIDDLGRVVIPKEIRRTMKIREGDPLEFFLQDGMVYFKKYSMNVSEDLFAIVESLRDDGNFDLAKAVEEVAKMCKAKEEEE
jgi:stage V sporulation protein T